MPALLPSNESDLGFVRMNEDNEETYLEGVNITGEEEPSRGEEVSFWRNCLASETKRFTKARLANRRARSIGIVKMKNTTDSVLENREGVGECGELKEVFFITKGGFFFELFHWSERASWVVGL